MNLRLCHTNTAGCTCEIISNAPAVNTRDAGFACTLLHHELHNVPI